MRVMVTGAAGFIGSHLAEALLERGDEVVGVDGFVPLYPRAVKEANLENLRGRDGFQFEELDLRTDPLGDLLEGADAVVHLAAMAGLLRSWTEFDEYASCNLGATQRLLEAMGHADVRRLVHVSTSSVYGLEAVGDEDQPTRPVSPYGVTKLAAEALVGAYASVRPMEPVILRYFSIYGPRQRPDMGYHRFIEALLAGQRITVYGDGRQSRSNTYVDDCVAATVAALDRGRPGATYNVGGGEEIDVLRAIEIIADALGVAPELEFGPPRPGDQLRTLADVTRAGRDLGYAPTIGPDEGLRRQVVWHVERRRR